MSEVLVGVLGFLCIIAIVVTLFKSLTLPSIAFILFPSILALILVIGGYYSFDNIAALIKAGFSSTGPTAALFVFSVLYFGIMTDAGMFDVIIGKLMGLVGDSVIGVCLMTAVIALIGHLDGGGASTFCIVVPAMLPVYKRMHMRTTSLLRIAVLAMGVLNLMPWAGPTMRAASVLGMEAGSLWQTILPIQIAGILLAARTGTIKALSGDNYEMDAVCGLVIGGYSMSGGFGSTWRAVVGVYAYTIMKNLMDLVGMDAYTQTIIQGVVLVAAVALDVYLREKRAGGKSK
jgi:Mg2+/citrate symporter